MSSNRDDWNLVSIFESGMRIGADDHVERVFKESLLNHIIQFFGEDDPDTDTRRISYRVSIEVREDGS